MFRKPQGPTTGYVVQLEEFEGPLDLLLNLVDKEKLDITEISLAAVAGQYQSYLERLHELNVEIESSYLVVFAQLLEIKSRVLLPDAPPPEDELAEGEEGTQEGAPTNLVDKLRAYKVIKEISDWLGEREGRSLARYPHPGEMPEFEQPALDLSLGSLATAMRRLESMLKRTPFKPPVEVKRVEVSVPERARQIWEWLTRRPRAVFRELLGANPSRGLIVVTFLAVLEMARREKVRLAQNADDIEITRREDAVHD